MREREKEREREKWAHMEPLEVQNQGVLYGLELSGDDGQHRQTDRDRQTDRQRVRERE